MRSFRRLKRSVFQYIPFSFRLAVCDDTTTWPTGYHGTSIHNKTHESKQPVDFPLLNTNKQNGLNPPDASVYTPSRKKPKPRLDRPPNKELKNEKETTKSRQQLPLGVIKHYQDTNRPAQPPPFRSQPDYITPRRTGGSLKSNPIIYRPVPGLPGTSHGDIYGSRGGERHDMETWGYDRYSSGGRSNKEQVFVPQQEVFEGEEDLIKDTHGHTNCDIKCEEWEFTCIQSCTCLHKDLRCDGNINCSPYGEDEKDCQELNEEIFKNLKNDCEKSGERILCPNTFICISNSWLCDGDDDCLDFSDETHCGGQQNCSKDQFECLNGLCIPNEWVCDSDNDCKDNSDEFNCTRK